MNEAHIQKIAGELKVQPRQVLATAKLFAEGATVPFIARYRKEATGMLDEVAVTSKHPNRPNRPVAEVANVTSSRFTSKLFLKYINSG